MPGHWIKTGWINLLLGVQGNMKSGGEDKELTSYMDQMDEELSRTSIGESFEKVSAICLLHGLSWGLVTEQARSARAGDKEDKRELEESEKRERGMMGTSAERVHASRELCPVKMPPISLIINSNISPKSDRERMGTRHQWDIFLDLVDTKWVSGYLWQRMKSFPSSLPFRVYCCGKRKLHC